MAQDSSHCHCHMSSVGLEREMGVQLAGERKHVHRHVDSHEAGQLQASVSQETLPHRSHTEDGSRRAS